MADIFKERKIHYYYNWLSLAFDRFFPFNEASATFSIMGFFYFQVLK